ncbi:MAG TPA: ParB/RepB/Spo0J family partition protein [Candidatus Kapabacteria bacterium]|jgi:ParB family chromosome partitioning protein|nr:ParB/RepB/Spo0J family partition protein [Candidatus Kapabacteria bacterium]
MSKTRSVLGKGLSALIPGASAHEEAPSHNKGITLDVADAPLESHRHAIFEHPEPRMDAIEIAKIAPNPLQPRKEFPKGSLDELTQSIREHGVIQAVTVRKAGPGRYELISGERRIRAAIEAGLTEIPVYVIEAEGDRKMLELAIIENVQRLQFNPIEEAEAYQRLIEDCGLTQEEVAEKIAKDRTTVANFIRLLRLPEPIKDSLRAGELGLGHAKAILGVPDSVRQIAIWEEAVRNHYSVRKLEELARKIQSPGERKSKTNGRAKNSATDDTPAETSNDLTAIENTFKQILGTQVKVRVKPDRSGEVAIQFYSYEDLERIQDVLASVPHT